jgi:hypothetical protein
MTTGIELIAKERERQIEEEGWTAEHDDAHDNYELAYAAMCYINDGSRNFVRRYWPWDWRWWKPTNKKRNLIKAGALIAAELDRLERLGDALKSGE